MNISKKNSKQRPRNLKKTAKRLAAYSAAAAATVMTTQDRSANAAEVVHDILDMAVGAVVDLYFNVITGATSQVGGVALGNTAEGSMALFGSAYPLIYLPAGSSLAGFVNGGSVNGGGFGGGYRYADALATSSSVTAGMIFGGNSSYAGIGYGNFGYLVNLETPSGPGIVGLRFKIGGDFHYGWAQITDIVGTSGGSILHGFGYNDAANTSSHPVDTVDPIAVFGDLNGDFLIDAADWVILRDAYNVNAAGDLDENSVTDIDDFGLFRDAFELANPAARAFEAMVAAAAVPEPSSILLLAAGAAGLGMWRTRRAE